MKSTTSPRLLGKLTTATVLLALLGGCAGGQVRTNLPSIELERIDGGTWNLQDESGRIIILQFFASFDNSSISLSTALEQLHIEYREQGVSVVGVAMDPPSSRQRREVVEAFCALNNLTFEIVLASDELGNGDTEVGRIPTIPATVIFNRAGDPVASATGPFRRDEVIDLIEALIHGRLHPLLQDAR